MAAPSELTNLRRSWLERLLDVVRELGTIGDLSQMLDRIAQAAVEFLEFGAAAINVIDDEGVVKVAAVAGPPQMQELLGQVSGIEYWLDVLDSAEAWGSLRFLSHEQDQSLFDQIASWVPAAGENSDPDAWHPEDALFAPLTSRDGTLLGVLSVDQPAAGLRPNLEQCTVLELFANQAAVAIADFQARELAEQRQREAEHRWEVAFERSPVGAAIVQPGGVVSQANESLAQMFGLPRTGLVGMNFAELAHPEDAEAHLALFQRVFDGERESFELYRRYLRSDGQVLYGLLHVGAIKDQAGAVQSIIAQLDDMTQRKQAEDQLAHRALHDALTELPNRNLLEQQLAGYLRLGRRVGVLYCDLDRFKTVNDSLGHEAGDELLLVLSRRIAESLPTGCVLGRVGGDEFVALVPQEDSPEALSRLAGQIMGALRQPLHVRGHRHTASVSIGITVGREGHTHPDEVLREASLALLRAKRSGPGRIEVYDPTQDKPATLRDLELEEALNNALATDHGLIPYYQPIVNLADNVAVGYESLVRWRHDQHAVMDPSEFLPMAEHSGLIVPLGWWMLRNSCRAATDTRLTGGWSRWVAVNVSGSQLGRGELVSQLRRGLEETGLPPSRLHLEITESALVDASQSVAKEIRAVADLGVQIALDDFGTGYSSLSLLRDLPVSTVKIDRSFIGPIGSDRVARAIVRSVIALCQELQVTTVAEGIETEEQLTSLRALGCTLGQGYLLGRPAPL